MPRVPAPVRIVTPKRGEAEHHEYAVRVHTAHEPSGRRTTINREAIVESATPDTAAAAAVVHIAHTLRNEGRQPPDGTRYQVSIHGESENMDWTLVIQHRPPAEGAGRHGSGRPESTYRQRADEEDAPVRTRTAERSKPEMVIGTAGTAGTPTKGARRYFVKLISQKGGGCRSRPKASSSRRAPPGPPRMPSRTSASRCPGSSSGAPPSPVYQVDVVRAADENLPYDAWHIEVIYETKKGTIGGRGVRLAPTVH